MNRLLVMIVGILLTVSSRATGLTEQDAALRFTCETFPADLSEADLVARYGSENVTTILATGDGVQERTVLYPDTAAARVELFWWNGESRSGLAWAAVRDPESAFNSTILDQIVFQWRENISPVTIYEIYISDFYSGERC